MGVSSWCRSRQVSAMTATVAFILTLLTSPVVADCHVGAPNVFSGAIPIPGRNASVLREKLVKTSDYGDRAPGWLIQRLYPLDDSLELSGELVADSFFEGDRDLGFLMKLSLESFAELQRYFLPITATPKYVQIALVKSLPGVQGELFKTWRPATDEYYVRIKVGMEKEHALNAAGPAPNDWTMMSSLKYKYIRIRGALVVNISGCDAGSGGVEIHPAEYVELSEAKN